MLNVLWTPFPPILSSLTASLTPSAASPTPLTRIWLNPCATPLWSGPSGHLADPTPNTGYEPKFCIDVSSEHTPINLPTRKSSFQLEWCDNRRFGDLNFPRHTGASSSSRHTEASTVPTSSVGTSFRKLVADYDSVVSQTSSRKLAADVDHATIVPSVFESASRRKRDRDQNDVHSLKDRQNLQNILARKAELAARRRSNTGKRGILILVFMRLIRSLNPNDYSYNRRISGWSGSKREEKFVWRIGHEEILPRKPRERLTQNWRIEKIVSKKQIELDKQELTNSLCIKRGILRLWVSCWLNFRIYRTE